MIKIISVVGAHLNFQFKRQNSKFKKIMDYGLNDRLFEFSVRVIKFLGKMSNAPETKMIKYQLSKSSASSGANYEEAQAGSSKADFINKMQISLREMRESNYWLRIIKHTQDFETTKLIELKWLLKESE